jgi:hypothetical protein
VGSLRVVRAHTHHSHEEEEEEEVVVIQCVREILFVCVCVCVCVKEAEYIVCLGWEYLKVRNFMERERDGEILLSGLESLMGL